jgi:hypothetical protein
MATVLQFRPTSAPAPVAPIAARAIVLTRAEGSDPAPRPAICAASLADPWDLADGVLRRWARTAPTSGGGYHKCDFTIHWSDGETYQGRYDLTAADVTGADLAGHVRGFITTIQSAAWVSAGDRAAYAALLTTYAIPPARPLPVVVPVAPVAPPARPIPPPPARYISCAGTAKLVRAALKAAFPAVKFSVRSETYSGGASIDVRWTDGPTVEQVEAVAKPFSGGSFDGMTDCMNYHSSTLNGERVHYAADFVFCIRHISVAFLGRVAAQVCATYDQPVPPIAESGGDAYFPTRDMQSDPIVEPNGRYGRLSDRIMLAAQETSA